MTPSLKGEPSAFLPSSIIVPRASWSLSSILARVILICLRLAARLGHHAQPHDRARLAANHLDDVVELHIDDIDEIAFVALADADNPVACLELAVLIRRAAGDQLVDHRIAIVDLQLSADAFQMQTSSRYRNSSTTPGPCRCCAGRSSS